MTRDGRGVKAASESSIEITFTYQGIRCRERIALKPTPVNLKRAEHHRSAIMHAITTDSFDYAKTFPRSTNALKFAKQKGDVAELEAFLEAWLKRQQQHMKASSWDGYRKIIDGKLIPWFGKLKVSELRKKHMREQLEPLVASNKTMANIQSVLRKALDDAIEEELIDVNPLANWTFSKNEAPSENDDIDPFSKDEQAVILEASSEGQGQNFIEFMFWSGMRTSEAVAFDWPDVDWIRGVVMVTRAITQHSKAAELTKTAAGRREIKLLEPAMAALKRQKQHTWLKGEEVFQNPRTGERWTGGQAIRKTLWMPILKRCGVRYRYPYQTRHTYASMMLSAGEHPMWVAKQMGHKDWTMIARVYGRWMPDADAGAGSRAESVFARAHGEPLSKAL